MKINKIAVIGLGYVGLPLAIKLGKYFNVYGYDKNNKRINELKKYKIDLTGEVQKKEIINSKKFKLTNQFNEIVNCDIFIITLPTPINNQNKPHTKEIIKFCKTLSLKIKKKFTLILESTVYPGFCDNEIKPIFERKNLKINKDFFLGYSPERINPGKTKFKLNKIVKVISGSNDETINLLKTIYSKVTTAGLYKAESIKIAEAAKVIENTQRDVNVALINEFAKIFKKMDINIYKVLDAASTKWNFLNFKPGMVGGHCISVDPYYLAYQSKKYNVDPKLILTSRIINNSMPRYISENISKKVKIKKPVGLIMGLTFKENCSDIRNSGSIKLIKELIKKKHKIYVYDPKIDKFDLDKLRKKLNLKVLSLKQKFDYIVFSVEHDDFKKFKISKIKKLLKSNGIVFDLKNIYDYRYNFVSI